MLQGGAMILQLILEGWTHSRPTMMLELRGPVKGSPSPKGF